MQFKINLKPYPGAPYFTVSEHLRRFRGENEIFENLHKVESTIRMLFGVKPEYSFGLIPKNERANCIKDAEAIMLDDPNYGERCLAEKASNSHDKVMLDLSYSFPQLADAKLADYDSLLIDPGASLGVPNEFLMVFDRSDSSGFKPIDDQKLSEAHTEEVYVLAKVLEDIEEKGMEMLVRESNYKAAVLYQLIESSKHLAPVSVKEKRSKSIVMAQCEKDFLSKIKKLGYELSSFENEGKTISFPLMP